MLWIAILGCTGSGDDPVEDTEPAYPDQVTLQCRLSEGTCEELWYSSPAVESYYDVGSFQTDCDARSGIYRERPCHRGENDLMGICEVETMTWDDGEQYVLRDVYYWAATQELGMLGEEIVLQCELAGGTWSD